MTLALTLDTGRRRAKKTERCRPEKEIQKAILQYLTVRGIFHFTTNNFANQWTGKAGIPDIVGTLRNGRSLYIEVKNSDPRSDLSDAQKKFRAGALRNNAVFIVARSVEDVERGLGDVQS